MINKSKWIWHDTNFVTNQRVNFFFEVNLSQIPQLAEIEIGCETKYWLFVNGKLAVFDGGLFRESTANCGYFDSVDITPYLKLGKNAITVHVWYYGNGGRNNKKCGKGGLILACDALGLYSGDSTLCALDHAYYTPENDKPSYLYGGDNTAYDARIKPFALCPVADNARPAVTVGSYGDEPWGELAKRPVPPLFFGKRTPCDFVADGDKYTVDLPYAMHASPYIKLRAHGDELVDIRTDRYRVSGGPGDHLRSYRGHRAEYVCSHGEQEFEMLDWLFGEQIIFTLPDTVEIIELGYRESGYDSEVMTEFSCNDESVNVLFKKCVRTLKVCMRENYMDCPDRERGQWIGDVSVQAPQIMYLLDNNARLLLRKAICDFINLRNGDVLRGNVPGDNSSELPSQSLNAISKWGMIASYYKATKEKDILRLAFEPSVRYLALWETDSDGVVIPRKGNWEWYDHLFNCDKELLNVCWYYSALRFASFMANELDDRRFDSFLTTRMTAIEKSFDQRYWHEKGVYSYYSSNGYADDRANAMAVLSGLCPADRYENMRFLLMSVFNATPYMENYVLIALCEMGYKSDAFRRMMCRYQPLIANQNSTLWEDFFQLGTRNHAWSGAPATVILRYFVGIREDLTYEPQNDIAPLTHIKCRFINRFGKAEQIESFSCSGISGV